MEKGSLEPSAPPPPYQGSNTGVPSVYPTLPSSHHASEPGYFPGGTSAQAQSAYPSGPVGNPPQQLGGYPQGPGGFQASAKPSQGYPQQSGFIPLHPGLPVQQPGGSTTVVYQQQQPTVRVEYSGGGAQGPPERFTGQIIFSCITAWCCFCPLGLTAFILAMVAQNKAHTDREQAHRLGIASYVLSSLAVVAFIVGIIILVLLGFLL